MKKNKTLPKRLDGKTIVITGASSGVGRAAAEAFAQEGCNVVLAARGKDALEETARKCRELGAVALAVPTDVSKAEEVQNLAQQALQFNGRIDIWLNNAGVLGTGVLEEMPIEIVDQIIKTNLLGYLHGAHTVMPIFKRQQYGVLLNNISIGGWLPAPYGTAYSASKFGLRGMVETLQGEVSDQPDIHVCALYPGIQRSTGNMHAAKFSNFGTKIPPISFDPRELAQTMVETALKPQKEVYPDWSSVVFKTLYQLFPKLIVNTASAGVRMMMKTSSQPPMEGNVLAPIEPHRIYGETMLPAPVQKSSILLVAGLGAAATFLLMQGLKTDSNS